MTRDLLERCRHRIANDCMAGNVDGYRLIAEIDAALAEPKAEGAHTPGEWLEGSAYGAYQTEIDVPGRAIATVWTKRRVGVLSDEKGIEDDPEGVANMHLVKAAPAMLAALEPFARTADDYGDDDPDDTKVDDLGVCDITLGHCRAARAAYRKAKGGGA